MVLGAIVSLSQLFTAVKNGPKLSQPEIFNVALCWSKHGGRGDQSAHPKARKIDVGTKVSFPELFNVKKYYSKGSPKLVLRREVCPSIGPKCSIHF